MTHWATEGIPFFKGAFILKDNQRRSICQPTAQSSKP
jgi:hypothetical protein